MRKINPGQFKPGGDPRICRNGRHGGNQGGRPPNWLRDKCRDIIDRHQLIDFFGRVATGKKEDFTRDELGRIVKQPARVRDRIAAAAELRDMGYGKPTQNLNISSSLNESAFAEVISLLKQRLPSHCPHCKTALALREEIGQAMLQLSERLREAVVKK